VVAQWLRCYATSRKVAGSIPYGFIGIFHCLNSSDRTGVDSASSRNKTRSIFWGKVGRCVRLTILPPSCAVIMKSGNLNFLERSGPLQACKGTALAFTFTTFQNQHWSDQTQYSDTSANEDNLFRDHIR